MNICYHKSVAQGSDEWYALRCGILTASEIPKILTPKLKIADNEKASALLYELAGQRITSHVEPHYISDDMVRGHEEEVLARIKYQEHYAPVDDVGFVMNNKWGFTIGYSPDGIVGEDGQIECKSRRQKFQVQTIAARTMPDDYIVQIQAGLMVTERKWCDFVTYCGGMPMYTLRVKPNKVVQGAIIQAASEFYAKMDKVLADYYKTISDPATRTIPTERTVEEEMIL